MSNKTNLTLNKNIDNLKEEDANSINSAPSSQQNDSGLSPAKDSGETPANSDKVTIKKGKKSWIKPYICQGYALKDKDMFTGMIRKDELDSYIDQGYEPVTYQELEKQNAGTILDGKKLDSVVTKREMIMVKLPKEAKQERDAYYQGKVKGDRELAEMARDALGRNGYGEIKINNVKEKWG